MPTDLDVAVMGRRHLDSKRLGNQYSVEIKWIDGDSNQADSMTKAKPRSTFNRNPPKCRMI